MNDKEKKKKSRGDYQRERRQRIKEKKKLESDDSKEKDAPKEAQASTDDFIIIDDTEKKRLQLKLKMRQWREKKKQESKHKDSIEDEEKDAPKEAQASTDDFIIIDDTEKKRLQLKLKMRQWREKKKQESKHKDSIEDEVNISKNKSKSNIEKQLRWRSKETHQQKEQRLRNVKEKVGEKRRNENPDEREQRLSKNREKITQWRTQQDDVQYQKRLADARLRDHDKRKNETEEEYQSRLVYSLTKIQERILKESEADKTRRLMYDNQRKKARYKNMIVQESQIEKQKRLSIKKERYKQKYSEQIKEVKLKKELKAQKMKGDDRVRKRSQYITRKIPLPENEKKLIEFRKKITEKSFLGYICVCEETLKERNVVKVLKVNDDDEFYMSHVRLNADTKSMDGKYYICKNCDKMLRKSKLPQNAESRRQFICPSFPEEFVSDPDMKLNKLEAYLLKLIIPFMRIGRIPRSNDIKLFGGQILVPADIVKTLDKILPRRQHLIPVAFKRRQQYQSSFIREMISRPKVLKYFEYLIENNHLYKNFDFSEAQFLQFQHETCQDAANIEEKVQGSEKKDSDLNMAGDAVEIVDDGHVAKADDEAVDETDAIFSADPTDLKSQPNEIKCLEEKELPDVPGYINNDDLDTIIIPDFNHYTNPSATVSNLLAEAIMQCEKEPSRRVDPEVVILAPGEDQKVVRYQDVEYMEEKAFPHLFPDGKGGYLSTHVKNKTSWVRYYRSRMFSVDARFRKDHNYVMFLMLVKEKILLSQCIATFYRKANKSYKNKAKELTEKHREELLRYNVGYMVFQNIRGFPPYFSAKKSNILAQIRQIGMPRIFFTFSCGELNWDDLLNNILKLNCKNGSPLPNVKSMSKTEKRRLISENLLLVTDHFYRRVRNIVTFMRSKESFGDFSMTDHFYRTEFQMRGAPHVHGLGWLTDENGESAPEYDPTCPGSKEEVEQFVDEIISCSLTNDDEKLNEKVKQLQFHHHTKTCRKKKRGFQILPKQGLGIGDPVEDAPTIRIHACRFDFPRMPMRKTTLISAPDKDEDVEKVKKWRYYYLRIRNYMNRQLFSEDYNKTTPAMERFFNLTYDDFLQKLGLTEKEYLEGLKFYVGDKRTTVFLKRSCREVFINNYNVNILRLLDANHDLQFVTNAYSCVQYMLDYTLKNDTGSSKLLKEIDDYAGKHSLSTFDKLKAFQECLDKSREVSVPEIMVRLVGLPMAVGSRLVKHLILSKPDDRDGLLKPNLDDLKDGESPFLPSNIDYYMQRPDELEDICYAEFSADYTIIDKKNAAAVTSENVDEFVEKECEFEEDMEPKNPVLILKNDMGKLRKRKRRAILRYFINKYDEVEQMRNYLLLFTSYRDEESQIHNHDRYSIAELFSMRRDHINRMREQFEPSLQLLVNIENAERNVAESDDDEAIEDNAFILEEEKDGGDEVRDFIADAKSEQEKNVEKIKMQDLDKLHDDIDRLNKGQRCIFDDIINSLQGLDFDSSPFHLFISGEAGTGKSFLMKLIIEAAKIILCRSGQELDRCPVLVLCPTATAANIVGGTTIESALKMFSKSNYQNERLSPGVEALLHHDLRHCRLLIIDEISMVGSNKFMKIHERLVEVLGKHQSEPFGGLSVIVTGDFHQLPPVMDTMLFNNCSLDGRPVNASVNWWKSRFKIFELKEKMRTLSDPQFAKICDRLSKGLCDDEMEKYLQQRVQQCVEMDDEEEFKNGNFAIIVATNSKREYWNNQKNEQFRSEEEMVEFKSIDKVTNVGVAMPDVSGLSISKSGNLPTLLRLRINSPVMITKNINNKDFLTNGSRGYVRHIDFEKKVIWVNFADKRVGKITRKLYKGPPIDDRSSVPIQLSRSSFPVGNVTVQRIQYPLTLSYAITTHKSQGLTLKKVFVDFLDDQNKVSDKRYQNGLFYVAVSRVKNGADLMLSHFDKRFVRASGRVLDEMERMQKNATYRVRNLQLADKIFTCNDGEKVKEIKMAYLNINGLMHKKHLKRIQCDKNLTQADILCLAETKISSQFSSSSINIEGFTVVDRLDSLHEQQSQGMVLYKRDHVDMQTVAKETVEKGYDYITVLVEGVRITFLYINPHCPKPKVDSLSESISGDDVILGDCNMNLFTQHGQKRLCKTFNQFKRIENINVATHNRDGLLDHVMCNKRFTKLVWATAAGNLYSDHQGIICRVALNDCQWIDRNEKEQQVSTSQTVEQNNLTVTPQSSEELTSTVQSSDVHYDDINITLKNVDFDTLNPSRWLNDHIINAYMALLASSREGILAIDSFFYTAVINNNVNLASSLIDKTKMIESRLILFPINYSSHWFLVTGTWNTNNCLQLMLYDSLNEDLYSGVLNDIKAFLTLNILNDNFRIEIKVAFDLPVQMNDFDCGIFCLSTARSVVNEDVMFPFHQIHMAQLRKQMIRELKNKHLEDLQLVMPRNVELNVSKIDWSTIRFQNKRNNSCWLNAIMQILLHSKTSEDKWTSPLGVLFNRYLEKKCPRKGFDTFPVKKLIAIKNFKPLLQGQHDPLEFLQSLSDNNLFVDISGLFTFLITRKEECFQCGNNRLTMLEHLTQECYVSIDITNLPVNVTVSEEVFKDLLFKRFTYEYDDEKLCYFCTRAGLFVKDFMFEYPKLLFIHINRLGYHQKHEKVNFTYRKEAISLPESFTLNMGTSENYHLKGIVQHFGSCDQNGRTSGHYTSLVHTSNRWYRCNDFLVEVDRNFSYLQKYASIVVYIKK